MGEKGEGPKNPFEGLGGDDLSEPEKPKIGRGARLIANIPVLGGKVRQEIQSKEEGYKTARSDWVKQVSTKYTEAGKQQDAISKEIQGRTDRMLAETKWIKAGEAVSRELKRRYSDENLARMVRGGMDPYLAEQTANLVNREVGWHLRNEIMKKKGLTPGAAAKSGIEELEAGGRRAEERAKKEKAKRKRVVL